MRRMPALHASVGYRTIMIVIDNHLEMLGGGNVFFMAEALVAARSHKHKAGLCHRSLPDPDQWEYKSSLVCPKPSTFSTGIIGSP